ncbi:sigma-70 family RNA polymerase sigma factor [Microbacterium keratanolyticum]
MQTSTRDQWIIDSIPLVGYLARTVSGPVSSPHREALTTAGALALVDAADSFDPARDASFTTHAQSRILAAFATVARDAEVASLELRMPAAATPGAADVLGATLGRPLTVTEVAMVLGVDAVALREPTDDSGRVTVSFEDDAARQLLVSGMISPEVAAELDAAEGRLRGALDALPERLAHVMRGLYFEGRTAASLAEERGVGIADVLQERAQALRVLRGTVAARSDDDAAVQLDGEAAPVAPAKEAHYSQIAQRGRHLAQSLFPQRSPA